MKYRTTENAVHSWLEKLANTYRILAPKKTCKSISFKEYSSEELEKTSLTDLLLHTTHSAKSAVIPQSETLFDYIAPKDTENLALLHPVLTADMGAVPSILFGTRPCDAKGLQVLDLAYLGGKYQDPYYKAKRDTTLLITQTCQKALSSCFCNWTDTELDKAHGSDILFTQVGNDYVFEGITEKGQALLKEANFNEANENDLNEVKEINAKAKATLPAKPAHMTDIASSLSLLFEDKEFWNKSASGCLNCSSCTYVCPTCQCFNITDEGTPLQGKRIRAWASCMSNIFTREASGHNPRQEEFTRWRNRLSHKFNYFPSVHEGVYSCTGCGRCLISCPSSISIKNMVSRALEKDVSPVSVQKTEVKTEVKKEVKSEIKQQQKSGKKGK